MILKFFSYMMIAPTIQQTRCKTWLKRHLPADGSVAFSDVTSAYTAICIMGSSTRQLLSELTDTDLNPKNFPFFTYKVRDFFYFFHFLDFNLIYFILIFFFPRNLMLD